jgi:hypothetical protein
MKELDQLAIELQKNASTCWYPSAGIDIPACLFVSNYKNIADTFILTDPIYRDYLRGNNSNYHLEDFNFNSNLDDIQAKYTDDISLYLRVKSIDCRFEFRCIIDFGREIQRDENDGHQDLPSPYFRGDVSIRHEIYDMENSTWIEMTKIIQIHLIGVQNEVFAHEFLLDKVIKINCLIHKNASGWGGFMSGVWKVNILSQLDCKYFATTICPDNEWNVGDEDVIERYPRFGPIVNEIIYSHQLNAVLITVDNTQKVFETISFVRGIRTKVPIRETNSEFFGLNKVPNLLW